MKANTENTVRRTIVLMIASMLLLTSFVCYWLNSQYKEEHQLLQKDLLTDITTLQRDITDSIIMEKYLGPVLQMNKDPLFTIKPTKRESGDTSTKIGHTFILHAPPVDTAGLDSVKRVISKRKGKISDSLDSLDEVFTTITIKDGDTKISERKLHSSMPDNKLLQSINMNTTISADKLGPSDTTIITTLSSILRTALKEAMKDSLNKMSVILDSQDLQLIHKEFSKGLSLRNNAMKAKWYSDYDSLTSLPDSNKAMLIHYNIYSNSGTIAITGYSGYIIQKLIPQGLFVLLLLAVVSLAFIVTYRAMLRQIKLSEMKNGLISNMSHELKTPVATVKVALEAIDDYGIINNPEQAREYIHMAKLETQRLEMLISKALNTSLMEQGKITLQQADTDIAVLTDEIIQSLRLRAQQNNTTITLTTEGDNFTLNIDKLHIQGTILNIIDNSIKYGNPPVDININILAQDATVTLTITDNGPGIPDAYKAQIFEKFFRVPTGDRHNVQGYGLGLSYVKQVMDLHGGMVQVNNVSSGGCRFTLQFFRGR